MVRVDGSAKVVGEHPPAYKVPAYVRKYRELIKGYDGTPKVFSEQYKVASRVKPTQFH